MTSYHTSLGGAFKADDGKKPPNSTANKPVFKNMASV